MSRYIAAIVIAIVFGLGGWFFVSGPDASVPASKAEHGHDEPEKPHVKLSDDQISKAGIKVELTGPVSISETLALYGVVAPNGERTSEVAARFPGTVRSVAKRVGDVVKQGDALATVESNESLQTYTISAPASGVVIARNANPGEQTAEKILFTVADLSTVWVELSLFPRDAAKVHPGQRTRVIGSDAGLISEGEVVYVAPVGNMASQTRTVRVLLDNAARGWAPGIYVSAEITLSETPVPIAVRNEAIQNLDGQDVVFIRNAEGFEPRPLKVGRTDSDFSEVVEGIVSGVAYATSNSFILKADLGKGEAEHED